MKGMLCLDCESVQSRQGPRKQFSLFQVCFDVSQGWNKPHLFSTHAFDTNSTATEHYKH